MLQAGVYFLKTKVNKKVNGFDIPCLIGQKRSVPRWE
jgi:hypothetical protein